MSLLDDGFDSGRMLPVSLMGLSESELTALASEGALITENKMMGDKEMGVIRHVLTAIGGVLVYMGYTDDATWTMVAGSMATMVGFMWSWMSK